MVIGPMMAPTRTRRALPTRPRMIAFYEADEIGDCTYMSADPASWAVEEYDQVHSADVDASKRFQELRLSRGFLPVVVALREGQQGEPAVASGHSKAQGRGKRPVASLRARVSLHRPSPELRVQRSAYAAVDLAIGPAHALHHKQLRSVLRPIRTSAPPSRMDPR